MTKDVLSPKRNPRGATAQAVADSLKLSAAKRSAMARQILAVLRSEFEHEVDLNARKLGLRVRMKLSPDSAEYKRLAAIAAKHAASISDTDAKFLDGLAERLSELDDREEIFQRYKDALKERWGTTEKPGWKLRQIRDCETATAQGEAVAAILQRGGLGGISRVHFNGDIRANSCPECAYVKLDEPAEGYEPAVAERLRTPLHPNCPHFFTLMPTGEVPASVKEDLRRWIAGESVRKELVFDDDGNAYWQSYNGNGLQFERKGE